MTGSTFGWMEPTSSPSTFTDDKFERGCFIVSCGSPLIAGTVEDDERDAGLQVRIPVSAGPHVIGVTFAPERNWHMEGVGPTRLPLSSSTYHIARQTSVAHGRVDSGVERVEIGIPSNAAVPQDSPSRRRIFVCHPTSRLEEEPCGRDDYVRPCPPRLSPPGRRRGRAETPPLLPCRPARRGL